MPEVMPGALFHSAHFLSPRTDDTGKEDDLRFRANDVITVLDDSDGEREAWWSVHP